jgi:hypothetical protein
VSILRVFCFQVIGQFFHPCVSLHICTRLLADVAWLAWSDPATWADTLDHPGNPFNMIQEDKAKNTFIVTERQYWNGSIPGEAENVWIPYWKQVRLDTSTPGLGRVIVEGTLVVNGSDAVNLTATYLEIKGGKVCRMFTCAA